ncbi:MAG: hypothetical protein LBG44_01110 [Gemmatimonadota bacterium]|jgi:hypothetical protein|nr:hypothetical protein [Gemmatimonadota bacterium]
MTREDVFRYLNRGEYLAAERESTSPQRSAWVSVSRVDPSKRDTQQFLRNKGYSPEDIEWACHVRSFEVDRDLVGKWIYDGDVVDLSDKIVFSEKQLIEVLKYLIVPIEALDFHYRSDYPL